MKHCSRSLFQNLPSFREIEGCWESIGIGHKAPLLISPLGQGFLGSQATKSYLYDPEQRAGREENQHNEEQPPYTALKKVHRERNAHIAPSSLARLHLQASLCSAVFLGKNAVLKLPPLSRSAPLLLHYLQLNRICKEAVAFGLGLISGDPERMSNDSVRQICLHCCIHIPIKVECLFFPLGSTSIPLGSCMHSSKNLTVN